MNKDFHNGQRKILLHLQEDVNIMVEIHLMIFQLKLKQKHQMKLKNIQKYFGKNIKKYQDGKK